MNWRQSLIVRIFPGAEQSSKHWHLFCPKCDDAKSLWDHGGIRYGAPKTSERTRSAYCDPCGKRRWMLLRWVEEG